MALVAIAAAILYLTGLGRPALWEPDEGRYGEIAREMVASGDYVTPRDDYEIFLEKPPLVYWTEAAAISAFGKNEFAVRLPAALFSVGEVVLTAMLGEIIAGPVAGLFAALALGLSPLFFGFARFATVDPALAFFLTAAMAAFYLSMRRKQPGETEAPQRGWMLTASAMLALGTLAKGPVAIVLGGAIALIWLAIEGRIREILRLPLLRCIVAYTAIVVPWFAIVQVRNPAFLRFFFIHEHLERYTHLQEHAWGPWFFIPIVIGGAWPWIFFVAPGIAALWRSDGEDADSTPDRSSARFLITWFAVIFIFFSIPSSKLGTYILPAFPPLAIAAGCGLQAFARGGAAKWRRFVRGFTFVNLGIAATAAIVIAIKLYPHHRALAVDGILIASAVAAGAILIAVISHLGEGRAPYAIGALALAMAAAMMVGIRARRDAAPLVSYRELAHTARPYLRPGCVLASYRHLVQSLPFYTEQREIRVEYWGELSEFPQSSDTGVITSAAKLRELWRSNSCALLIANQRDLAAVSALLEPAPMIIGCEGKKFILYKGSSPAPPEASECVNRARLDR